MSRAVCRFFQQGNCRYGDSCRFEHPRANNNRFGVFGGGSSGQSGGASGQVPFNLNKDTLKKDLTEDLPPWILSAYGPGKDAPDQLWGGFPLEQSFEELRLHYMMGAMSGNPQKAISEMEELYQGARQRIQNAVNNVDGAIQYIVEAEKKHPNRLDICREGTQPGGTTGEFAVGKRTIGGGFGSPAPAANPFGAPAASGATGAFGQPSTMGQNKPNPFGTPSFGQPSQPAPAFGQPSQPSGAFGQPSQLGGGTSAFGQPSQMGGNSAFGQTSALGQKPSAFGAPAFGQPSQPSTTAAPAFGQPSQPNTGGGAFGQPSQSGGSAFGQPSQPGASGGSAFGQPSQLGASGGSAFGQSSQLGGSSAFGQASALGQKPNPFGGNAGTSSPFGSAGAGNASPSPFGQAAQATSSPSPFGASSTPAAPQTTGGFGQPSALGATTSPFGQAANTAAPSPFGSAAPAAAANPFGKPSQPSPFGAAPASQAMETSTPAASSPFGQPSAPSQAAANPFTKAAPGFGQPTPGGGGFGAAQTAAPAAAGAAQSGASNNPYPPNASRQHPPFESYSTKDMAGNLATFKGKPVAYKASKDGGESMAGIQNFDGSFMKIWFPKGPPLYYEATEVEDSKYDDKTKAAYEAFVRTGKFEGGMPELPPKREWCAWDF